MPGEAAIGVAHGEDVGAHRAVGGLAVAALDRLDHDLVLGMAGGEAAFEAELGAPEGCEAPSHLLRRLDQEGVAAAFVDRAVKRAIERLVAVDIAGLDIGHARLVQGDQVALLGDAHPLGGEPRAGALELRHHLEHLQQPLEADIGDDHAAMRPLLDEATRGEPAQGLANRGARDVEATRQGLLVQLGAGCQRAVGDVVGELLAQALDQGHAWTGACAHRWRSVGPGAAAMVQPASALMVGTLFCKAGLPFTPWAA